MGFLETPEVTRDDLSMPPSFTQVCPINLLRRRIRRKSSYQWVVRSAGRIENQNPVLPALLSIDLEQEARLDAHEEHIKELEATVDALDEQRTQPRDTTE